MTNGSDRSRYSDLVTNFVGVSNETSEKIGNLSEDIDIKTFRLSWTNDKSLICRSSFAYVTSLQLEDLMSVFVCSLLLGYYVNAKSYFPKQYNIC